MATRYTLSIKGTKQGDIKSEVARDGNRIPIFGFNHSVVSPRDAQSGLPTGQRQHKPLTIIKEWGVISPQLFQALANNENLPTVVILELRTDPAGKEFVYMEIHLTNANIAGITINPERSTDKAVWTGREIEEVAFTYQKIDITNNLSKVTAMDDWEAPVT